MCPVEPVGPGFRSGFVGLIGRPNVGKSTLLNRVLGRKVAIIADKPQTTRNRILGVHTGPDAQIIFIDTPGIHRPRHRLGEYMVRVAVNTLREVDIVLFLVEADARPGTGERVIAEYLADVSTPCFLVVNKADLVDAADIPAVVDSYRQLRSFAEAVAVSALRGDNVDLLVGRMRQYLPEGPLYYPAETVTDQPEQFIVAELVREKVIQLTHEEVPHAVAVGVEEMVPRKGDLLYVRANVYVERESQKGILIGEGGRMLKEVGRLAREELEGLLGTRLYLDLWVKVKKDWRNREGALREFGYHHL